MAQLLFLSLFGLVWILSIFGPTVVALTGKELPCRLVWVRVDNELDLPGESVASHPAEQFIVRGKFNSQPNEYVVGRWDVKSRVFFLPQVNGLSGAISGTFEILTNPEDCHVEWKSVAVGGSLPQFPVSTNEFTTSGQTSFVGRHYEGSTNLWYGGHVKGDEGQIYLPISQDPTGTILYPKGEFDVLTSYSDGITMDLSDFEMSPDIFGGNADFVGMDEIHNGGPGSISLNIEHKKTVIETYEIEIRTEVTTRFTTTVRILFFKIKTTTTITTVTIERASTREETEMTVSHQVDVPPFSSVQACSVIKMSDAKKVSYTARAQYTAKGMTGEEVAELLKKENIVVTVINGVAERPVTGELQAQMALNTEFTVVPFESRGCNKIARKLGRAKKEAIRRKNFLEQQLYGNSSSNSHI